MDLFNKLSFSYFNLSYWHEKIHVTKGWSWDKETKRNKKVLIEKKLFEAYKKISPLSKEPGKSYQIEKDDVRWIKDDLVTDNKIIVLCCEGNDQCQQQVLEFMAQMTQLEEHKKAENVS